MFGQFNSSLKLTEAVYNADEFSSIKRLADARLTQPDLINSFVTYAYGADRDYGKTNFPLMFYTNGLGRKRAIKSIDGRFQSLMYGKPKKTSTVARNLNYVDNNAIGKGYSTFKVVFKDRWFMMGQELSVGNLPGFKAAVKGIEKDTESTGFIFTLQLVTANPNAALPLKYTRAGTVWAAGVVKVALQRSRGTESRSQSHFRLENQLSRVRHSYNFAGNVANKVMNIEYDVPGRGKINTFTDWEMYLGELQSMEVCEDDLIFSQYNRDAQGNIHNKDENGEDVPSGMGIWQQIVNEMQYGILTEKKLDDYFQSVFYNADMLGDGRMGQQELVIVGGTGLMMQIDGALKRAMNTLTLVQSSDLFVRGSSDSLQYGGYFTSYKHRSGRILKFVEHPLFNRGIKADSMDRHPLYPNMSLLSFCGMVLDFSKYSVDKSVNKAGQESNITFLYEDGAEYQDWYVLGGSKVPSIEMNSHKARATDIDQSSYHVMKSQGVHVNYPGVCSKIVCTIS